MNKKVKEFINRVYIEKGYKFFKNMCYSMPSYLELLENNISKYCKEYEIYKVKGQPEITFYINYNNYNYYKFNIEYLTIVNISKICNVYYIQHEFNIDNLYPNRTELKLNGFDNQTYTIEQYNLESKVVDILSKNNLKQLQFIDLKQIINLDKTEGLLIEKQITLEDLLFKNIYNIV